MSNKKVTTEIALTKEGLRDILIKHYDMPEDSKLSFKLEREQVHSRYDDPRDPPSYRHKVTKIIIKHEAKS